MKQTLSSRDLGLQKEGKQFFLISSICKEQNIRITPRSNQTSKGL